MSEFPEEWRAGAEAIRDLPDSSVCLVVGASDRGKTTFVTQAARFLALEGLRTAVVDADIGQSEIGPPGTVGVAGVRREWATDPASKLSDLKATKAYFVGAFMPSPVALELVTAVGQSVRFTRDARAQRILVDTTGYVSGPAARRLKVAKSQAVSPALILGIGKDDEITDLLEAMQSATGAIALSLKVPGTVGRKSPNLRATRRMTRLDRALEGATEIALPLTNLSLVGCTLGNGSPLTPELVRWIADTLRLKLDRVERGDGTLTLFAAGRPRPLEDVATAPIASHFKVQSVRLVSLGSYTDAYIGLHDPQGNLLSVGRFLRLDAERNEIVVSAPPPATRERVRLIFFGRVAIPADASGYREIRPGEL